MIISYLSMKTYSHYTLYIYAVTYMYSVYIHIHIYSQFFLLIQTIGTRLVIKKKSRISILKFLIFIVENNIFSYFPEFIKD